LFRSRDFNLSNTELLVLVTPHIVDPIKAAAPAPPLPKTVVPFLDNGKFDKQYPENKQSDPANPAASAQ